MVDDDVLIVGKEYISNHFHGMIDAKALAKQPVIKDLFAKGSVHIGKKVCNGEGVCIVPGVSIGENSINCGKLSGYKGCPTNCVAAGVSPYLICHLYD